MRRYAFAPALLVFVAVGCGGGGGQGEVSGKVTYKNKPVPGGLVTFRPADGRHNAVTVELDNDGNYPAVTLPAGEVTVLIDNSDLAPTAVIGTPSLGGIPLSDEAKKVLKQDPPRGAGGSPKRSARYVEIPAKYLSAETSGLKFKVERGAQKKDFELTD